MHASALVAGLSPATPDVTHVYDSHAGRYYDNCCHKTTVASAGPLPATPNPFVVMGAMPAGAK